MIRLRFEWSLARVGRVFLLGVIGAIGVLPGKVSADVPETKEGTMIWSKLSAHWNNGTLPPPYRRSGSVIIHADGRGERHSVRGYDSSGDNTVIVPFQLTPGQIDQLSRELVRLKAFDTQWKEMDQHPVGTDELGND
ncbi:MAG: hypothetical protein IPK97_09385 [Ahniella sp.]|nr:hypothetical protein [Ahniella sp.]